MENPTQQTPPPVILGPPGDIDAATLAFCATISPHAPFYVPVDPQPHAKVAYCFDNSVQQAEMHGGEAAYGWAIWHWPGRWFEAEHHAVWRRPDGTLLDVTPQLGDPARILFLPDPDKVYDPEKYRRNVMAPDAGNPLAAEYIDLVRQRTDITDRYWYPGVEVLPLFSEADRALLAPIDARMTELRAALNRDPSAAFVAAVSDAGHPLHAAWREMNRSVDDFPSRGLVRHHDIRKLMKLTRRDHPGLADGMDPRRIALWEPQIGPATRWVLVALGALLLLSIGYLVHDMATRIARSPTQPPIIVTPASVALTNQRVDTDRALEAIFDDQLSIADIEDRNPSLAAALTTAWSEASRRGDGELAFQAAMGKLLEARYRLGVRGATDEQTLEYYRIMLDIAREMRGRSVANCAGFVTGSDYDAGLVPPDMAQREVALAARVLPEARDATPVAPDFTMPPAINQAAVARAKIPAGDFDQALRGKGSPENQCSARIALWETLLELPAAESVPLLRKI